MYEYAPGQFADTAKDALTGLLSRRGIGPYTVDHHDIASLIHAMIEEEIEPLKEAIRELNPGLNI